MVLDYVIYMTGNGADAENYIETARIAIFRSQKHKWAVFEERSEFNFNRSFNWANTDVTFVLHRSRVVPVPWVWCNRLGTVTVSTGIEKHRDYRDIKDKLLTEKSLKIPTFWKFMSRKIDKTFKNPPIPFSFCRFCMTPSVWVYQVLKRPVLKWVQANDYSARADSQPRVRKYDSSLFCL